MSDYISYEYEGKKSFGILDGEYIYDLGGLYGLDSLLKFIELDELQRSKLNKIETIYRIERKSIEEVRILPPIEIPKRGIFCVGKNYQDHAVEIKDLGDEIPKSPIFFTKNIDRILGTEDSLDVEEAPTECADYEGELAIIIKNKCKNLKSYEVWENILGFTVANDFTARELQTKYGQWTKGKSLDRFLSMGPVVKELSKREVENLNIKAWVNGELRQDSNTSRFIFDIEKILVELTMGMTLFPGDIVLTGTPSGVGAGFNPPKYLKTGDKVEIEIEKIGRLVNYIK